MCPVLSWWPGSLATLESDLLRRRGMLLIELDPVQVRRSCQLVAGPDEGHEVSC